MVEGISHGWKLESGVGTIRGREPPHVCLNLKTQPFWVTIDGKATKHFTRQFRGRAFPNPTAMKYLLNVIPTLGESDTRDVVHSEMALSTLRRAHDEHQLATCRRPLEY